MTPIDGLPEGLTARPLTHDDAEAVTAVVAAEEVVDLGEPEVTVEDVLSDWLRPSYDITASTVGVLDGDLLVAYGDHSGPDIGYTAVLPAYQGRGIGTAIAHWLQAKARAAGSPRIGTQVAQGSAADRLLADLGYEVRWTAWDLELPADREISARALPDGFALRDAGEADREAAWTLVEDCFLEWSDRERMSLGRLRRPGLGPRGVRAVEPAPAGLAGRAGRRRHARVPRRRRRVRRPDRGPPRPPRPGSRPGDAGRRRSPGRASTEPSAATSPPTPGRGRGGLYEKVGMEVASTWVNRAITL